MMEKINPPEVKRFRRDLYSALRGQKVQEKEEKTADLFQNGNLSWPRDIILMENPGGKAA